jgi:hypothetical protein
MRCGVVDRGICYEANEPIEHMYGSHRELYVYINLTPKLHATIMRYLLLTKAHILIFTVFGTDYKFGWEYLKNYVQSNSYDGHYQLIFLNNALSKNLGPMPHAHFHRSLLTRQLRSNVRGEPVFSVMAAGWFCEKSGQIGKVEDVEPVL